MRTRGGGCRGNGEGGVGGGPDARFRRGLRHEGTGDGQFRSPFGVATDSADRIIVADTNNHRVQVFDSTGAFNTKFGTNGKGDGNNGRDTLSGGSGDDNAAGDEGRDILRGIRGRVALEGGPGTDVCDGGSGVDTGSGCNTRIAIP